MRLDERFRWLAWLCLIEIGTMLVFSNYSAVLPFLQKEWSLSNIEAGWIFSSYQIGYIIAVVFFTSLTDYTQPKSIYVITAIWAGTAGILFSLFAEGFYSALFFRTLMGIGFAGTYMPGLRMVSEKFPSHERGKAVGIYVAAFSLGVSLSMFLTGYITSLFSWRWAFLITSLGPMAGGAAAIFKLKVMKAQSQETAEKLPWMDVVRNRPVLFMIGGYVAHMWEMFGMRGWMVPFLTACLLTGGAPFPEAVGRSAFITGMLLLIGAVSNFLGGALSDRFGRIRTVTVVMLGSGFLSLVFGWTRTFPFGIVVAIALLYGFLVSGESSVLSTGVTELARPGGLGRTMALQSLLGFGAASLSPILFGYILDITNPPDALQRFGYVPNWGWAFVSLGIGALMGPLIVLRAKNRTRSEVKY